jgi:hypothetical protein
VSDQQLGKIVLARAETPGPDLLRALSGLFSRLAPNSESTMAVQTLKNRFFCGGPIHNFAACDDRNIRFNVEFGG